MSSGDAGSNTRQPVFVQPIGPAGFAGAVLGPAVVRGLTPLSDVVSRDPLDPRFVIPDDSLNPFSAQRAAQLATATNESGVAGPLAGASALPVATAAAGQADKPADLAAVTPAPAAITPAANAEDCVDKPVAKPKVKPKVKLGAGKSFGVGAADGSRNFSEQVGDARKAFKPPVKVQPAVARNC